MRRKSFIVGLLALSALLLSGSLVSAQAGGLSVTCRNGATFENGIEIIVNQMRSGFTYTATAVGVDGFDPVLAVVDTATGDFLCSDDENGASRYSADLPTVFASSSGLSAQVTFNHNDPSGFLDISLVVGGFGNATGEFVLILEGMAVTSADGAGDPFSVNLTPGMVASGVPLSVYMLTRGTSGVDPLLYLADATDYSPLSIDGEEVMCDDAGSANLCFDTGFSLDNSSVTIATGTLPGWEYDAMLSLSLDGVELDPNPNNNYLTYIMTSYNQTSEGQYLLVFHMGMTHDTGSVGSTNGGDDKNSIGGSNGGIQAQPTAIPTAVPNTNNSGAASGVSVTCNNGATFDNGVEIIVNQMRSGFTYTATAIGVGSFDPVLAVVDLASGDFLCSDDETTASRYSADLPTAFAPSSGLSSQVSFSHSASSGFADISLVVGGFGNATGEFVLILEGMAVTNADGAGDPFSVNLTPGMVESGVPLSVYMFSREQSLDPLMYLADPNTSLDPLVVSGEEVSCDDAGSSLCYDTGSSLENASVNLGSGSLGGGQYDAMLSFSLDGIPLDPNPANNYFTYVMTSYSDTSLGQYLLAFHMGITAISGGSDAKSSI